MLDFKQVGADLERFRTALARRPAFDTSILDRVRGMWAERSGVIQEKQALETKQNAANADMQKIMKTGTNEEKTKAREEMKAISNTVRELQAKVDQIEATLQATMLDIPNVPHPS